MQPPVNIDSNLQSQHIQVFVLKILLKILKLLPGKNQIAKSKLEMILKILVLASSTNKTIHHTCKNHEGTPTGVTVRNTLKLLFSEIEHTEKILNRLLRSLVKREILRGSPIVNSDLLLVEYYGSEEQDINEIRRSQAKNGTTRFHGYATVYINLQGQRYTLAITYVWAKDSLLQVLQRLNRYVISYGVKPSLWIVDRGYYSVEIIKWFQRHQKPFLMPVPKKGLKPDHPNGPSGTRKLYTWNRGNWTRYTIKSKNDSVTCDMAVVVTYPDGPGQYRNPKVYVYACFGIRHLRLKRIYELYKSRFGIETSHRQMHEARAKTASRSPVLRYLFVGIGFVLRNVWIYLHFHVLYIKRQGSRLICFDSLTFIAMLDQLRHCIEQIFPLILETEIEDPARILLIT